MQFKLAILLVCCTCFYTCLTAQVGQLKIDDDFELSFFQTMQGDTITLDPASNKVLVMNFWNLGCRGCEAERPYLNELHKDYQEKEIVFWSVTTNTMQHLEAFLENHPIDWEIKGGVDFLGFMGDDTFKINCMPTTIVVDKEKKVIYSQCGPILEGKRGEKFKALLDKALLDK
ncbi:MAG: TlpA disulfide reductase family protein [Bacteroidota bacterium]